MAKRLMDIQLEKGYGEGKDLKVPKRVTDMRKAWSEGDAKRDAGLAEPEGIKAFKDISYGPNGIYNLLDVYRPGNINGDLPVLVNVHGGGYFYGDKELYKYYSMDMAMHGFAVVNFNYRLSPEYKFPDALEDINNVMLFVEANKDKYHFDLNRVFMMGDSAGAQLTSHYAALNSDKTFFDLYDLKPVSIKLKGIALACGMYDIKQRMNTEKDKQLFIDYAGDEADVNDPRFDVLSHITEAYPPAYIFSCPNDFLYACCEPMAELINKRGGKATSKIYGTKDMKEVGHVFHCNLKLPIGEEARAEEAKFLLKL